MLGKTYYTPVTKDGEILELPDRTKLDIFIDALTDEMYIERYNKRYTCMKMAEERRNCIIQLHWGAISTQTGASISSDWGSERCPPFFVHYHRNEHAGMANIASINIY